MILGVVSDIHCNAEGLRAAVAAMGSIDRLICLGDTICDYRFSNEVVALLREYDADVIKGNHEEGFFAVQGARARQQPWIDAGHMDWLAARPDHIAFSHAGKKVLAVHSTSWFPRGTYVYAHSPELKRFGEADADLVLYGHTHMQLVSRVGRVLVVNPGSAGESRDPSNGNKLSCAVINLDDDKVKIIDY